MFLPDRNAHEDWLGVVIAVPEPWVSQITEARLALGDRAAESVPPHVTIMPPQAVAACKKEEIFTHLEKVASRHRPFRITIDGTGTFMPASPVVYLNVTDGADECGELAEDVRFGPLDYSPRFPYHPHITIAQGLPEQKLLEACAVGRDFKATWMVTGFRLDKGDATGSYNSTALFNFS